MNTRFKQSKVWNGLLYYNYARIVQLLKSDHAGVDRWIAVYNLKKHKESPFEHDFVKQAKGKTFIIIVFNYKHGADLYEEGFMEEYFKMESLYYVDEVQEIWDILEELNVDFQKFVPPGDVDFPLGW